MSKFWSRAIDDLKPYTPGEQPRQPGLVKLNTNESPFGPSPAVAEAIRAWPADRLRLYPDPDSSALRAALAQLHGVEPGQVFVGNGSDEVLAHAFSAFFRQELPLLMPDISYAFYRTYCRLFGIDRVEVPLDADFRVDVRDYQRACGGVVIANPNAPTGVALPVSGLEALLRQQPDRVVLIDEAYVDFGGETAVPLLAGHPNLLVVRTFSKSRGLAGIRVGYALGSPELVEGLERVKNSFNSYPLSSLSVAAAIASLGDEAHFAATVDSIASLRAKVTSGLQALDMAVLPSSANFVFASHPSCPAARLVAGLRERNVLVRHFDSPRIDNFLRITIGSAPDCDQLLAALKQILA